MQKPWTQEETEILRNNCNMYTAQEIQQQFLPTRTAKAISAKIHRLSISTYPNAGQPKSPDWSLAENKILEKQYRTHTVAQIQQKFLPHRTEQAIAQRISRLKLSRHPQHHRTTRQPWTASDLQALTENYAKYSTTELQSKFFPTRTTTAIKSQAEKLHLHHRKQALWSEEEVELLKTYYTTMKPAEFRRKHMPDRPIGQIYSKANRMGLIGNTIAK